MSKSRILVVDDDGDGVLMLSLLLEGEGHEVKTLTDGRAAPDAVEQFRPQIVMLDLHMPNADGFEVARQIRDRFGARPIIIAMTGTSYDDHNAYEKAMRAGFNHYLTKPYLPGSVFDLIKRYSTESS